MAPRFLFFILAGLLVYLSLALYHGHQVKKLPQGSEGRTFDSPASIDREKNWVQVTTDPDGIQAVEPEQVEGGRRDQPENAGLPADRVNSGSLPADHVERVGIQEPHLPPVAENPVELRSALEQVKMKADNLAREKENLLFRIDALQTELQDVRARLQAMETERQQADAAAPKEELQGQSSAKPGDSPDDAGLVPRREFGPSGGARPGESGEGVALSQRLRQALARVADAETTIRELNDSLAVEKKNRQRALDEARGTREELARARRQGEQYLAEIGRLQALHEKTKTRLITAESEMTRSRLKAEAMLRYGREQDRLLTPFRQEIELLHARLEDVNSSLARSEREVAALRATGRQHRQQAGQRGDGEEAMDRILADPEPTAAGERQD